MSHTEGKLTVESAAFILDDKGRHFASIEPCNGAIMDGANARRLVATWNACGGIPTDMLEGVPDGPFSLLPMYDRLSKERDELVKVLREERSAWNEAKSFSEMRKMHDACDAILARYQEKKS